MRTVVDRGIRALPWLFVVVLVGLLGRTWLARLPYPYDLEWMEGGMLAHAWRLSQGQPIYLPPNPEFVPYIYPPGYASMVAWLSAPVGVNPLLGRVLSLLGTAAAAGALTWLLRQRRAPWSLAVAAGAVFVGTYRASGAFYDLVRPDGLYVGLLAWSVVLALSGRRGTPVAAGLLLAASFTMKHNAAAFGVPLLLGLALRGWRPALQFAAASMGPALALVALLQWRSSGLFLTYLLEVPRSHPAEAARLFPGTPLELGMALPIASASVGVWLVARLARAGRWPVPLTTTVPVVSGMLLAWWATRIPPMGGTVAVVEVAGPAVWALGAGSVAALLSVAQGPRQWSKQAYTVALVWFTALALAAVMRAHNGGYLNVHIHMYWAASLVFALCLVRMPRRVAAVVVSAQLVYSASATRGRDLRPTEADRAAGDRFVEQLRERPGPVLAPFSAWLPTYAGHPPSLHYMGVWDLDYPGGPLVDELDEVRKAVRKHHWPTAIDGDQAFPYGLRKHYRHDGAPLVGEGGALRPKTGWPTRPERLMVPKG